MRRSTAFILAGLTLWIAGVVAVSWAAFDVMRDAETIQIQVADRFDSVHFAVPALFPSIVLNDILWVKSHRPFGVHHEMEDWGPAVLVAMRELEAYDDVPLLEIRDGRDHVRIEKRGERVVVEVLAPHESVRVSMPLRLLRRTLERYES